MHCHSPSLSWDAGGEDAIGSRAGAGVGTAETVTQVAVSGNRHATITLAPGAGNTTPAQYTPICNGEKAGPVPYTSGIGTDGKQTLTFLGRYGTGLAVYRFSKQ